MPLWPRHTVQLSGALGLVVLAIGTARAGDHRDTELLDAEAAFDIADVFAWTSPPAPPQSSETLDAGFESDPRYLYLAMTLRGRPVPGAQYVFHLDNRARLASTGVTTEALCTFDQSLEVQCWLGDEAYAAGDASSGLNGLNLEVWTGFIDDPTFADVPKIQGLVGALQAANTSTVTRTCPLLTAEETLRLRSDLKTASSDSFKNQTAFVILLRTATQQVADNGDLLGVWASTRSSP